VGLQGEWASLHHLLERATEVVRPLMDRENLRLTLEIAGDIPGVHCDRTRVF
jgi:hypothetical protein